MKSNPRIAVVSHEAAPAVSDSLYRLLADHSPDLVALADRDGIFLYVAPSARAILRFAPAELIGKNLWSLIHPDDLPLAKDAVASGQTSEEPQTVECRMRQKAGGFCHCSAKCRWIRNERTGEFDRLLMAIRDVDKREGTDSTEGKGAANYRVITDHSTDMVVRGLLDGTCLYVSPSSERLLGYQPEEIMAMNGWDLILDEDREGILSVTGLANGESVFTKEFRMICKSGETIWCEAAYEVLESPDAPGGIEIQYSVRNVNQRRAASDELRDSAEAFRLMTENATDLIVRATPECRVFYASPAVSRILGDTCDEFIGVDLWDRVHPDDFDEMKDQYQATLCDPVTEYEPYRMRRKDGSYAWVETSARRIRDPATGEIRETQATFRDVTARVESTDALEESERHFRLLAENSTDIISRQAPDGTILYVTPSCRDRLGYSPDEVVGTNSWHYLHPDDANRIMALRATEGSTPKSVLHDVRMRKRDGTYGWFEAVINRVLNPDTGEVVELQLNLHDISQRKESEETLRLSEDRYRVLFEHAPEAIVVHDLDSGTFVDVNDNACRLFNMTRDELYRSSPVALSPKLQPDGQSSQMAAMAHLADAREGRTPTFEWTHCDKNGRSIRCEVRLVRLPDDVRTLIRGSVTDISKRKEVEARLAQLHEDLERRVADRTRDLAEANAALEGFSSTLAHDLRGPLRSVQGFATAIIEDYAHVLDETGIDYATRIVQAGQRMDRLTKNLLEFSRLNAAEIELKAVDLNEAIAEAVAISSNMTDRSFDRVSVEPNLPRVMGHAPTLGHAIANLVSNALKFVEQGRIPEVHISAQRQRESIRLFVADNGIGIAGDYLDHVFEPFARLNSTREFEGSGIGLAIVAKAVERMGGSIGVQSVVGKGSTFWIDLPRDPKQRTRTRKSR